MMTTKQGTARWARLIEIRDELFDMIDQAPSGVKQAVIGLNGSIMRLCPHDREQWQYEELQRFENINRVSELRTCPHCRARSIATRRIDRSPSETADENAPRIAHNQR